MEKEQYLIEIAPDAPIFGTFTYIVPDNLIPQILPGKRVLIPFNKRRITGYILGCAQPQEKYELKQILDILDDTPIFPEDMIPFFKWIADYYIYPLGEVINSAMPKGLNYYESKEIVLTEDGKTATNNTLLTPLEKTIIENLYKKSFTIKELSKKINYDIPLFIINSLKKRNIISIESTLRGGKTKIKLEKYLVYKETNYQSNSSSPKKQKIFEYIKEKEQVSLKKINKSFKNSSKIIQNLIDEGLISSVQQKIYRDPFGYDIEPEIKPKMTKDQESVVNTVINSLDNGFTTFLLAGVTGSGKTEVYMRIAEEVIKKGKFVIVLVPEIALISQIERRFRSRFGECIAILHSNLSPGEKLDQWLRILEKEVKIAIGPRSAIFAPFDDIGLIIVDEEHDASYKQETSFLYNAKDAAIVRAKLKNCPILLGSATPSLQSYYHTKSKKFFELNLEKRINEQPLPEVEIIDLRQFKELKGMSRHITEPLINEMKTTLERGEQVLLFLNRRGFANFPICGDCEAPVKCKHCDITLTLHQSINALKCHFCGYTKYAFSKCDICGSSKIRLLGLGTEKIEAAVKILFPRARIARMDRDTTAKKGSLIKILKDLKDRNIDILIGTQMVVKGHDFPYITLVGIICADLSLNFPDFRACEQTFQLLAQAAGRAGRGNLPGKVILQTYNPEHFSIISAKSQDFQAFYNEEIKFRNMLLYPPFSRLSQIKISGMDKEKTADFVKQTGDILQQTRSNEKYFKEDIEILGPIESPISKIAKHYRWHILLKGKTPFAIQKFLLSVMAKNKKLFNDKSSKLIIDIDPFYMM
ncbi:MAG: primosomal protein N' [Desulfobacterales bacterium]|nr:primosomal protein N' [Desulfobacterales bacterium]